ncbi:MAG TPA: hypothetical protein VG276_29245 [Actinomycetes bacterium]|jgi:hypothetical protein|nr:hypothetical protein [Actinomycetes bacterium]
MAHNDELLRISCDGCPGGAACQDCLVDFILAERDALVVQLRAGTEGGSRTLGALEPELEHALNTLIGAGLQPELLAVRRSGDIQRAS